MSRIDSRVPAEWFERAEKDYVAARHLLGEPEVAFVIPAAMLLQQALEKYLKGFLLARGQTPSRTRDLTELLDAIPLYEPELAPFDPACVKITAYYTEQRYPSLAGGRLNKEEVVEALAQAEQLIEELKRLAFRAE